PGISVPGAHGGKPGTSTSGEDGVAISGARAWALTVSALALPVAAVGTVVYVDDCLGEIALLESADLMSRLYELRLAPLHALSEGARQRLSRTLLAYIDRAGNAVAVADDLGIHPQTSRHR